MNGTDFGVTRFYTKQEVAEILRVSVKTITRYMKKGLPYRKILGTVRIPEDKFLAWMQNRGTNRNLKGH